MNTVTKVFIVLQTVASIAFVMVVVTHVRTEENWKSLADDYRDQAINAQSNFTSGLAVAAAEKQALAQKIQSLTDTNRDQRAALERAETARDAARAELASAQHDKTALQSTVTKLSSQLDLVANEASELRKQRNQVDQDYVALQRRNAELTDRNRELSVKNLTMADQIRQFQQQLYANGSGGATGSSRVPIVSQKLDYAEPNAPPVGLAIQGHVSEIEGRLATVSVGEADGVQPGMTFVVYRNDTYLGDIVIASVEPNRSIGDLTIANGDVRPGDQIAEESVFAGK